MNFEEYLSESFSDESDTWFDELIDKSSPKLVTIANNIKTGKLKPTEGDYSKFKKEISTAGVPKSLLKFISNIDTGKYKSEFKKMYGAHSQVSELFSLFNQAVFYNN